MDGVLNLETSNVGREMARIEFPDSNLAIETAGRKLGKVLARSCIAANFAAEITIYVNNELFHNNQVTHSHDGILMRGGKIGILFGLAARVHGLETAQNGSSGGHLLLSKIQ